MTSSAPSSAASLMLCCCRLLSSTAFVGGGGAVSGGAAISAAAQGSIARGAALSPTPATTAVSYGGTTTDAAGCDGAPLLDAAVAPAPCAWPWLPLLLLLLLVVLTIVGGRGSLYGSSAYRSMYRPAGLSRSISRRLRLPGWSRSSPCSYLRGAAGAGGLYGRCSSDKTAHAGAVGFKARAIGGGSPFRLPGGAAASCEQRRCMSVHGPAVAAHGPNFPSHGQHELGQT